MSNQAIANGLPVFGDDTYFLKNIGIGTQSPSAFLDIEKNGTVTSTVDFLEITNKANAASMTGTGTGISFNQWYYDGTTPALADAGRISVVTEGNWSSTASTQDASMIFGTALNGTITNHVTITSNSVVQIGAGMAADSSAVKCLQIGNGTAPGGHVDDTIMIYSKDSSGSLATIGFMLEEQVATIGSSVATHKIAIYVNGTPYKLLLTSP